MVNILGMSKVATRVRSFFEMGVLFRQKRDFDVGRFLCYARRGWIRGREDREFVYKKTVMAYRNVTNYSGDDSYDLDVFMGRG
mmetsp:Transcript_7275/g.8370  ORF Transcript_7275/g.8370 Transcript_7275/m.8370 type:complete len:83 (+) Transcript_7275:118-366(+)